MARKTVLITGSVIAAALIFSIGILTTDITPQEKLTKNEVIPTFKEVQVSSQEEVFSDEIVTDGDSKLTIHESVTISKTENNDQPTHALNSYVFSAIEPEEIKELATSIVKGKVIGKEQKIEYSDKETQTGEILKNYYEFPYFIYKIEVTDLIKGEKTPQIIDVKINGGEYNGVNWETGFDNYQNEDELILILEKTQRHDYYRPVSEFFGVYQIEDNIASTLDKEFTETELLVKLQ